MINTSYYHKKLEQYEKKKNNLNQIISSEKEINSNKMFERNYDVLWCSYGDQVTEKAEEKRKAV
jgi:hypothetical protein